jgi:hypothetical protein
LIIEETTPLCPLGSPNGTRPYVAAMPKIPDTAAGIRMLPPPSKPIATGTIPAATAVAEPEEEPPETKLVLYALKGPLYGACAF